MLESFLWFAVGAMSYKLVSKLVSYSNVVYNYDVIMTAVLKMLYVLDKEIESTYEYKYARYLETESMDKSAIEEIRAIDERNTKIWQETVIQYLRIMTPEKIRQSLKFKNWQQAMMLVERHKESINESNRKR